MSVASLVQDEDWWVVLGVPRTALMLEIFSAGSEANQEAHADYGGTGYEREQRDMQTKRIKLAVARALAERGA